MIEFFATINRKSNAAWRFVVPLQSVSSRAARVLIFLFFAS